MVESPTTTLEPEDLTQMLSNNQQCNSLKSFGRVKEPEELDLVSKTQLLLLGIVKQVMNQILLKPSRLTCLKLVTLNTVLMTLSIHVTIKRQSTFIMILELTMDLQTSHSVTILQRLPKLNLLNNSHHHAQLDHSQVLHHMIDLMPTKTVEKTGSTTPIMKSLWLLMLLQMDGTMECFPGTLKPELHKSLNLFHVLMISPQ